MDIQEIALSTMNVSIGFNAPVLLYILFVHWVGDFLLQSDDIAKKKSRSLLALLLHVSIYAALFAVAIYWVLPKAWMIAWFVGVTFFAHLITDFVTSRISAHLFAKKDIHYAFVTIGFDQFLHHAQLFITLVVIINW